MIVTIDGVAASGKSSVASGVAQRLGVPYLSSGLLYRAATYSGLNAGLSMASSSLKAPALLAQLERFPVQLQPEAGGNRVYQQRAGERQDITPFLHTSTIDAGVSAVAQLPQLREWVNAQLRTLPAPFVAEGRDMGTAVFPQAEYKFFLVASPRVRAERRVKERRDELDAVEAALLVRDLHDQKQSAPAPDAVVIDTGELGLEEVIARVMATLPLAVDSE